MCTSSNVLRIQAGQGMNVSMMDSYNLAWKLAYSINGLTPENPTSDILDTYHQERHTVAQQLIEFDKAFSSMFSGKIGVSEDGVSSLTEDEFLEVFSRGNGFTSGCGVEYPENLTVTRSSDEGVNPIKGTDPLSGILYPGRRLLNVRLVRHADSYRRDIQDGKYSSTSGSLPFLTSHRFPINWSLPHTVSHIHGFVRPDRRLRSSTQRSL